MLNYRFNTPRAEENREFDFCQASNGVSTSGCTFATTTWYIVFTPSSFPGTYDTPCVNILINTRLRQNDRHCPGDNFKHISLNGSVGILIKVLLKIVPRGPINNIMDGAKPLSEQMMVWILTQICVVRPQGVNTRRLIHQEPFYERSSGSLNASLDVLTQDLPKSGCSIKIP